MFSKLLFEFTHASSKFSNFFQHFRRSQLSRELPAGFLIGTGGLTENDLMRRYLFPGGKSCPRSDHGSIANFHVIPKADLSPHGDVTSNFAAS